MISCNDFIRAFCESEKQTIQVSKQAIADATADILSPLREIPYEKIRNRFRVLSSLDPVVNQKEEKGVIRISFATDEVLTAFEIISIFTPLGEGFILQKTTEPNQALEPTTLSVTLRAPSRTDRAS